MICSFTRFSVLPTRRIQKHLILQSIFLRKTAFPNNFHPVLSIFPTPTYKLTVQTNPTPATTVNNTITTATTNATTTTTATTATTDTATTTATTTTPVASAAIAVALRAPTAISIRPVRIATSSTSFPEICHEHDPSLPRANIAPSQQDQMSIVGPMVEVLEFATQPPNGMKSEAVASATSPLSKTPQSATNGHISGEPGHIVVTSEQAVSNVTGHSRSLETPPASDKIRRSAEQDDAVDLGSRADSGSESRQGQNSTDTNRESRAAPSAQGTSHSERTRPLRNLATDSREKSLIPRPNRRQRARTALVDGRTFPQATGSREKSLIPRPKRRQRAGTALPDDRACPQAGSYSSPLSANSQQCRRGTVSRPMYEHAEDGFARLSAGLPSGRLMWR